MAVTDRRETTGTRHRVPHANSRPRVVKLVGLGAQGAAIAATIGEHGMAHVEVVATPPPASAEAGPAASTDLSRALAAGAGGLAHALDGSDMIFVVVASGDDASHAAAIGRYGRDRGVLVTGVIIDSNRAAPERRSRGLDEMRRACDMLVVTADADDLAGMLAALGS